MVTFYPKPSQSPLPVTSRSHIALAQADIDAADPKRGVSPSKLARGPTSATPDLVQALIEQNQELWDTLINNQFCSDMGKGITSMDGFRFYMIQDLIYLRNYVRFKLGLYSKTTTWNDLKESGKSIPNDVKYATDFLATCTEQLGIPEDAALQTGPTDNVDAYCTYEDASALTGDWFSLHVLMLPCMIGYYQIAKKLVDDPTTVKNTVYYKLWIEPNSDESSAKKYRDFCNQNAAEYFSDATWQEWNRLFMKSCRMEIDFFKTYQEVPGPYYVVQPGVYTIKSNMFGSMVATLQNGSSAEGTSILSEENTSKDSQKWNLELTPEGYTIQNVAGHTYAGLSASSYSSMGNYAQGLSTAEKWIIVPAVLSGISDEGAFQIISANHQSRVLDLCGGSSTSGTNILVYENYFGTNNQKGRNQAWFFEMA